MARHAVIASLPFVGALNRTSRGSRQRERARYPPPPRPSRAWPNSSPRVRPFVGARILLDRHPPTADQHVLAAFIGEGHLDRHIRRLRGIYADQRTLVVRVFERYLPTALGHVQPCDQGMHMVVWLRDDIDDTMVAAAAVAEGVSVRAVSPMYAPGTERPGLLLGFGGYRADAIESAARRLAKVIKIAAGAGALTTL